MNKTSKTLYLECNAGISGDMTVAALLDLGADVKVLERVLESLPISGFTTKVSRVKKAGLDVCDFQVLLETGHENQDRDMEYLHGKEEMTASAHTHEHAHEHAHTHEHEHAHEHAHTHEHEHAHEHIHTHEQTHEHEHTHTHEVEETHHIHEHRGLSQILHIIQHADMTDTAKVLASRIFRILGVAEAKAHGVPEDEVHFHEVGAVDSIVDIIGAAVCLDNLGIEECIIPVLCEGTGTVRCQHGVLPIPVPAVANIVEDSNLALSIIDVKGEFVTPTGAAIAAAIQTSRVLPETFTIQRIGMGGGKREYQRPSILRAMLIETKGTKEEADTIWKLESNIDDCTGEALGYVMERLQEAGARDVHYTPVYMKKNRPAYQMNVICKEEQIEQLEEIIFQETTTIGIRRQKMERNILKRTEEVVRTSMGEAKVKVCTLKNGVRKYPEYSSVAELCRKSGKSYQQVYAQIMKECNGSGD